MSQLTILTPRLRLRPLAIEDAQPIASLVGNWNVARWLARVPFPYSLADAEAFILDAGLRPPERAGLITAIDRDGTLIGVVGIEPRREGCELGYWLGEAQWGNGYMSEAASALVSHFFVATQTGEIHAGYLEGNHGSARVLEKLGFERTGRRQLFSLANRRDMPDISMRLTRARFAELHR